MKSSLDRIIAVVSSIEMDLSNRGRRFIMRNETNTKYKDTSGPERCIRGEGEMLFDV